MDDAESFEKNITAIFDSKLSDEDRKAIQKLSEISQKLTGVQLNEKHFSMITSRLTKRLRELKIQSFTEYLNYFNTNSSAETPKLISLITTHHTYFFREFPHFELLKSKILPTLVPEIEKSSDPTLKIWVAACSRGQESYSLAMFLAHYFKNNPSKINYKIIGTDIDSESVEIAKNGVYLRNELKEVPLNFLGDHWSRGTGEIESYVKAKKTLREHCEFHPGNLLELKPDSFPKESFHLIFCRNVFIYFNQTQIKQIIGQFLLRLSEKGYLLTGITESLTGLNLPIENLGMSVYQRVTKDTINKSAPETSIKPFKEQTQDRLIRVLCVDDSASILTIMKKLLVSKDGFEVVGTATNGLEASAQVQALKPDVITLDIHMPQQTGIEYLEKNFRPGHPPVVMVSSVARENADLAGKALLLGASDYVEKPSLSNLEIRGEEIRNKIRSALLSTNQISNMNLEKTFQKVNVIKNPESNLRIIVLPLSARSRLNFFFSNLKGKQPPTFLLVEGIGDALTELSNVLSNTIKKPIQLASEVPSELNADRVFIGEAKTLISSLLKRHQNCLKTSILIYGEVSKAMAHELLNFKNAQMVLEDLGSKKGAVELMDVADDIVPHTSFAYLSEEFLSQLTKGT